MRRLSWSHSARRDLEAIESRWISERPDFVAELFAAARESIDFLGETPGAGSPVGSTKLRKWRIGRTPYLMLYRFTRDAVLVLRVYHDHQNWRGPRP